MGVGGAAEILASQIIPKGKAHPERLALKFTQQLFCPHD